MVGDDRHLDLRLPRLIPLVERTKGEAIQLLIAYPTRSVQDKEQPAWKGENAPAHVIANLADRDLRLHFFQVFVVVPYCNDSRQASYLFKLRQYLVKSLAHVSHGVAICRQNKVFIGDIRDIQQRGSWMNLSETHYLDYCPPIVSRNS